MVTVLGKSERRETDMDPLHGQCRWHRGYCCPRVGLVLERRLVLNEQEMDLCLGVG